MNAWALLRMNLQNAARLFVQAEEAGETEKTATLAATLLDQAADAFATRAATMAPEPEPAPEKKARASASGGEPGKKRGRPKKKDLAPESETPVLWDDGANVNGAGHAGVEASS